MEGEGRKEKHEIGKSKGNMQEETGKERTRKEITCTPRGRRRGTGEELRARERSNLANILEYVRREEGIESELSKVKRKRKEKEREVQEIFKRSNMLERTPPGEWREEKEEGKEEAKSEENGALIVILREIKEEMVDMRRGKRNEKKVE